MSAAVKGDTASGAGRRSASGFRTPKRTAESAALAVAPACVEPDAALIAACAEYPSRVAEDNAAPDSDGDEGPAWIRYAACRDVISSAKPKTMAGILAKARVAKFDAIGRDGREQVDGSMGQVWAWDLVNDLIRVSGGDKGWPARLLAGDTRAKQVWEVVSTRDPRQVRAWLRMGEAISAGQDFAEAERCFTAEISAIEAEGEMIGLLQKAREMMRAPVPRDPFPTLASLLAPKPWEAPLHAAAAIPAVSQEGIRAKAETVADWLAGQDRRTGPGFACDREVAVAWSLMRDILGADELAPLPPPRRHWTEEDEAAASASMPPPVTLPATPDIPWMWSNAAAAIRDLPVQGYRLSTACILEASRAAEGGDSARAHNLLMAASVAIHDQMDSLGLPYAINTDLVPKRTSPEVGL